MVKAALSGLNIFYPRRLNRIVQEHRPRHRAYASRYRRDPGRFRLYLLEPYVPDEATFFFAVDADVHDDCTFSYVLGTHHLSSSGGDDQNLGPVSYLREILREEQDTRRRADAIIVQLTRANAGLATLVPELEAPSEEPMLPVRPPAGAQGDSESREESRWRRLFQG